MTDYKLVSVDTLKSIHRDLDACQKVIWLAGGFDPAYCEDAQARLKEIDDLLSSPAVQGEPAAWQLHLPDGRITLEKAYPSWADGGDGYSIVPLYTAPQPVEQKPTRRKTPMSCPNGLDMESMPGMVEPRSGHQQPTPDAAGLMGVLGQYFDAMDSIGREGTATSTLIAEAECDEAEARLRLFLAAHRKGGVQQWQPIGTCPRHVDVLFYREDAGVFPGKFTDADSFMTDKERDEWVGTEEEMFDLDAWSYEPEGVCRMDGDLVPTHWMPLPAPPATQGANQ